MIGDFDALETDVRNLKTLIKNITPLMPVLTRLAQNPQLIEQLADDAGDLASDIGQLSVAVQANRVDVDALKNQAIPPDHVEDLAKGIAALGARVSALEAARIPAPHRHDEPQPDETGDELMAQQAKDLGAGAES